MQVRKTSLEGLYVIDLDVFADDRGSFREVWQAEKMTAAGLPEFQPVQQSVSVSKKGVIRGIHAEPWEKLIHLTYGTAFAAMVDLREDSPTFGQCETIWLNEKTALLAARGFGNSFQVTSEIGIYSYLVTAHWRPDGVYSMVRFDDPDLAISWPILGGEEVVSEKDRNHPTLREAFPHKFS